MEGPAHNRLSEILSDGVLQNILPLVGVVFRPAQLGVPKIPLPYRNLIPSGPMAGCMGFPIGNPLIERSMGELGRRTKEVNVIGHEHVTTDAPRCRHSPGLAKRRMRKSIRKYRLPPRRTYSQKDHNRFVRAIVKRRMCGTPSAGFIHAKSLIGFDRLTRKKPGLAEVATAAVPSHSCCACRVRR